MLCAWSSQYPHRPIPPDQSRSVYDSAAPGVVNMLPLGTFRTYRVLELALYHSLGKRPEPASNPRISSDESLF
jgi:hypothetical protein